MSQLVIVDRIDGLRFIRLALRNLDAGLALRDINIIRLALRGLNARLALRDLGCRERRQDVVLWIVDELLLLADC